MLHNLPDPSTIQPSYTRLEPNLRNPTPLDVQMKLIRLLQALRIEPRFGRRSIVASKERCEERVLLLGSSEEGLGEGEGRVVFEESRFEGFEEGLVVFFFFGFVAVSLRRVEKRRTSQLRGSFEKMLSCDSRSLDR